MTRPLRVLIIEDNEDDATLLLRTLRKSGYEPSYQRVETAAEMRHALTDSEWDCIISDYSMPHFNALNALSTLHQSGHDIPCLIVSGTITDEMAVATMRAGAHDYLMKDNLSRLAPALERELQEAAMRRGQRQAEADRRVSDLRFRSTFDQAAVGLAHADLETGWLLVNAKLCSILGRTEEEMLASSSAAMTYPEDLASYHSCLNRLLLGEAGHFVVEKRFVHRDGSLVWTNLTASLVRDEQNRPHYYIYAIEDISARKHTESLLHQRQQEVEALNVRLRRAMQETHHRVKNNLQVIAALVDMQVMAAEGAIPVPDVVRLGSQIRTLAMVHDILTEESKNDGEADCVSVRAILHKLIPMLASSSGNLRIPFKVEDVRLHTRRGTALALLVNELVSNAIKHGRGAVEVTFKREEQQAILEVCDDGPGFPPGFDPCSAAHTGLELVESTARWDLRGETHYANRATGGAHITVRFPLLADDDCV